MIVIREPATIGDFARQLENWTRSSCKVLAGAASSAFAAATSKAEAKVAARTGPSIASAEHRFAPLQALRRPERLRIVIGFECRNVRRQRDPRQFGASINMHVRREFR